MTGGGELPGGGKAARSTDMTDTPLTIAGKSYSSRLIVGTGKYANYQQNADAARAAGAEIVTVALRRVNLSDPGKEILTDFVKPDEFTYLPNTAGCYTADEAVRTIQQLAGARGAAEVLLSQVFQPIAVERHQAGFRKDRCRG